LPANKLVYRFTNGRRRLIANRPYLLRYVQWDTWVNHRHAVLRLVHQGLRLDIIPYLGYPGRVDRLHLHHRTLYPLLLSASPNDTLPCPLSATQAAPS